MEQSETGQTDKYRKNGLHMDNSKLAEQNVFFSVRYQSRRGGLLPLIQFPT